MNVELVPIDSVTPSTYNPRRADPKRLDMIELSLRKLGFVLPIYCDGNEIVSGHQRHHVAKRMGLTQIPVVRIKAMPIDERKAVNIVFNRGTNDMAFADTPKSLTAALDESGAVRMARRIRDLPPKKMFPCMATEEVPIGELVKANSGLWNDHTRNITATLAGKGIVMPVVATKSLRVVNGIGRVEYLAEKKAKSAPVVFIAGNRADLAELLLNKLSMDFNIEERYQDLLRYNSFRRARRVRYELGQGFTFAAFPGKRSKDINLADRATLSRWIRKHGSSVVDFGAGHLHESDLLRSAGIHVNPFEPYRLGDGGEIDKTESLALTKKFLSDIRDGKQYSSVFISSVLNSVPFKKDREHIACIASALCNGGGRLYACASHENQSTNRSSKGAAFLNSEHRRRITFQLDYEPNITLGDFQDKPKVQKFHTEREFFDLFKQFFGAVEISVASNNVRAVCADPLPVNKKRLLKAIEFEFDLPYPDGSNMGLVDEAKKAFLKRIGVKL
jgi:hypothetical protein